MAMTKKLLVTIALGAALAIVAAGTATSVTIGAADLKADVPTTTGALPQCADLSDNDGDGLVDGGDPGCSGALDSSEYNAPISSGDSGSSGSGTSGSSGGSSGSVGGGKLSASDTTGSGSGSRSGSDRGRRA